MKRRGYTLFEMAIVLALIVLLAGLAVPPLESMYSDYRLQSAVDEVRGQWAALRARAIIEGRPYRFACTLGGGAFAGAPDAPDFWSGGAPSGSPNQNPGEPLVVEDSLPRGILFGAADAAPAPADESAPAAPATSAAGGWTTVAVFMPDGTAQRDAEIVFAMNGTGSISLRLRALTGGVTSRWLPANAAP